MSIEHSLSEQPKTTFSYEILPPLKGLGIEDLLKTVEQLKEFNPQYINITTHQSEYFYSECSGGTYMRKHLKRRPGTVAIAASIQHKTGTPVVPHLLCEGYTKEETEYALLDLNYLGITHLLLLRGDKVRNSAMNAEYSDGYNHYASDLQYQVNQFNEGYFVDGSKMERKLSPFTYGVACYPEKHEESPNLERDMQWLKFKQDLGASYAVTQMFYDNTYYFRFVEKAREMGITIPIIPGIKPLKTKRQLSMLPKVFNIDLPESLVKAVEECDNEKAIRQIGVEWCITQCKELISQGVPSLHFYTMGKAMDVYEVAKVVY